MSLQKSPINPQKSHVYHLLRLDRLGTSRSETKSFTKEPHISAKEPYVSAKEPYDICKTLHMSPLDEAA